MLHHLVKGSFCIRVRVLQAQERHHRRIAAWQRSSGTRLGRYGTLNNLEALNWHAATFSSLVGKSAKSLLFYHHNSYM